MRWQTEQPIIGQFIHVKSVDGEFVFNVLHIVRLWPEQKTGEFSHSAGIHISDGSKFRLTNEQYEKILSLLPKLGNV